MKWIYFYTPDYSFWHTHLQNNLSAKFDIEPVLVQNINAISKDGKHHFHGITKKIDLVIDKIQENTGDNIVFSDCTLWINHKNVGKLLQYLESLPHNYDLVLADNGPDRTANIGLLLINCNKKTLDFFKNVRNEISNCGWDQEAVNKCLPGNWILRITRFRVFHLLVPIYKRTLCIFSKKTIEWSIFDKSKIVCGTLLPDNVKYSFFVYKQFISPSTPKDNWNQRIAKLYEIGLIDDLTLKKNLRS